MPTVPHNDPKAFEQWYDRGYFRRPRMFFRARRALNYALLIGCLAAVGVTLWPRLHGAYQAGDLSNPHAPFNDNCSACHDGFAPTARRLVPLGTVHATPDAKCLTCHEAGNHNPHQLVNSGPDDPKGRMSSDCAGCHREHRGAVSITRIDDAFCTKCHADLKTRDGNQRFAAAVTAFAKGAHPEFGEWRKTTNRREFTDPGTLKFNHKVHMELAAKYANVKPERQGAMKEHLDKLAAQSCTYCHQADAERRFMLPLRYDAHCKGCHPLQVRPAGDVSEEVARDWLAKPLAHPGRGQSAATVRGELFERYARLVAKPAAAPAEPARPAALGRTLSPEDRVRVKGLAAASEGVVFAASPTVPEDEPFNRKGGCVYCHAEKPGPRKDGLPEYESPKLRGRWDDVTMPDNRWGPTNKELRSDAEQFARDRWFPYSRFNHQPHRMLDCTACHPAAASQRTDQVLMPKLALCAECHHTGAGGVRADCLECHQYHDRSKEPHGLRGSRTVESIEALMRPGGQ